MVKQAYELQISNHTTGYNELSLKQTQYIMISMTLLNIPQYSYFLWLSHFLENVPLSFFFCLSLLLSRDIYSSSFLVQLALVVSSNIQFTFPLYVLLFVF